VQYRVCAEPDIGAVRRAVAGQADRMGAAPVQRAQAELVVTELATNLLRHAGGGWLLARPETDDRIELIAVDRGPGIPDLAAAIAGRAPAPKGLGCGLASVRRAAARFDAYTEPGRGSTVLSVVDLADPRDRSDADAPRPWGGVSVGVTEPCGDGWAVHHVRESAGYGRIVAVAVIDGLGHGAAASAAAETALEAFAADPADIDGFVARANDRMRFTRGAAATVCRLDAAAGELHYLAVGNVNGRVVTDGQSRGLITQAGTLGLHVEPPRARLRVHPWPPGAALVLWTDGLTSRFDLALESGLFDHDPAVVAATLYRDHSRDRDDATAVVVRNLDPA
jgi:anti-sigma regulatory factor (Ser/Thr protein kinase)